MEPVPYYYLLLNLPVGVWNKLIYEYLKVYLLVYEISLLI